MCTAIFVNWRSSIFLYQSIERTALNAIPFLFSSLVENMETILSILQQKFALVGVFNILPLNF